MLFEQIRYNKRRTVVFLMAFFLFIQLFGMIFGELLFDSMKMGLVITAMTTSIYLFVILSNTESVIMNMNNAKRVTKEEYPMLYDIVEEVSCAAGLKQVPSIYIIKENSPNAFATGLSPDKSAIAVTTALLKKLNREELEGVIAHEIAHIVCFDCRLSTVTIAAISAILFLSDFIFIDVDDDTPPIVAIVGIIFLILSPFIGYAIHFAISRNREYNADCMAVNFTRNPRGLKSALLKIDNDPDVVDNISTSCGSMYIADPFKKKFKDGKKVKKANIFSTHPSIESRIERLDNM